MNLSRPFILRPVGTTLLSIGLFIVGIVAYWALPVSSLPNVSLPTISVSASQPGADPETMASTVAAPLERRLGEIAGVTELTSSSGLGSTRITVQFDLSRKIESAARDVQAAINAATADLPSDLPAAPSFRKFNPSAAPVMILALTSPTLSASAIYDAADTIIAQRIAQVEGVAQVNISGADQPAIRIKVNPTLLASMGVSIEEVRLALTNANIVTPLGAIEGERELVAIETNAQMKSIDDYGRLIVKTVNGIPIRLSSVAAIEQATRNSRASAQFDGKPAVLLFITKEGEANVIDVVDRVHALLPELKRWVPNAIDLTVMSDRTLTIRASVHDMQITLMLSVILVMLVVFVFLRRAASTIAAGITVPLSLAGTLACMWLAGFSINNLTLMALAVSVGFVVDDAIVMIENITRNLERGMAPLKAAIDGARQIGFTVISISLSLIAAFVPLLFFGGPIGRFLLEFALTMTFAIVVSTIISLTVTPMICAKFLSAHDTSKQNWFDRLMERGLTALERGYIATLGTALKWKWLTLATLALTIAATVNLYIKTPKGFVPEDDAGLISVSTQASSDVSFEKMTELQARAMEIVRADPAVLHVSASLGASFFSATANSGRLFVALKPLAERPGVSSRTVVDRLRRPINRIEGLRSFMFPIQDLRFGGRQSRSNYQYTLWSTDIEELYKALPKVADRIRDLPGFADVNTDREQGGLQLSIKIDRESSARLGVRVQDINAALNNSFAQRQVSLVYGARNQYRVVLEVDPRYQRDPSDLAKIFVPSKSGSQIPITSVIRMERTPAPLVVNHQGPFPAATVSYNLETGVSVDDARKAIDQAIAELHLPEVIRTEAAGDAKAFANQANSQALLILAALLAVYIVLGVLYESLAHPITIISTLPSAGLGALVALQIVGMELSLIAFIGIILLVGIVKKNGIMLVDFALEQERTFGTSARAASRIASRAL
ncbi:MAG: acriflavine resistance protein B, partial [Hyphomicrobiaceae bacterium]|nr:acriflavine resistance protein B [Hyphomicrobiaceae bacterium]